MDVLSDVLRHTRGGPAESALATMRAPWALQFDDVGRVGFHVVLAGRAWLTPSDGDAIPLDQGDVALLLTGSHVIGDHPSTPSRPFREAVPTAASATGNLPHARMLCGSYAFDRSGLNPLLSALPPVVHLDAEAASHEPGLRATVQQLTDETGSDRPGVQSIVDRLVDLVLIYAVRGWTRVRCDTSRDWLSAIADAETGRALGVMHGDPSQPWSVESLAEVAGLSRAAFAKRFREQVGMPPMTYLASWRMRLAAERLRTGDLSIARVARTVGYENEFAFSRAFKRELGLAPLRYRQEARRGAVAV